jgi:hypothetical protein
LEGDRGVGGRGGLGLEDRSGVGSDLNGFSVSNDAGWRGSGVAVGKVVRSEQGEMEMLGKGKDWKPASENFDFEQDTKLNYEFEKTMWSRPFIALVLLIIINQIGGNFILFNFKIIGERQFGDEFLTVYGGFFPVLSFGARLLSGIIVDSWGIIKLLKLFTCSVFLSI